MLWHWRCAARLGWVLEDSAVLADAQLTSFSCAGRLEEAAQRAAGRDGLQPFHLLNYVNGSDIVPRPVCPASETRTLCAQHTLNTPG